MTRPAFVVLCVITSSVRASDPAIDSIDRALLVQKALADAKDALAAGDPATAAATLEAQLPFANVNRTYLDLLRKAYEGESTKLRAAKSPDGKRLEAITKRLAILDGTKPEPVTIRPAPENSLTPPPPPESKPTSLADAVKAFNRGTTDPGQYREASDLFARARREGETLTPDHCAAWAYCRVKVAAEELNKPSATAESARALAADVTEALTLAPENAGLQKAGRDVLASARAIAGPVPLAKSSGEWETVNGVGVVVRHRGRADLAAAVAKAVEPLRQSISQKWFGPGGPAWAPACEISIHPTATAFAAATGLSDRATGRAEVSLANHAAQSRRIDLRADDETLLNVTLPKELTHVVLADIFPTKPPPRWAEEAMAILSADRAESERFRSAAPRLAADGALPRPSQIVTSHGFPPADQITGFYVGSVAVVESLVSRKGEKAFAAFLTDAQRYGIETALKRQYGLTPQQLDGAVR
jgi:hypothetical protein